MQANHYEITGKDVAGSIDTSGIDGEPTASVEVDGVAMTGLLVTETAFGYEALGNVSQVADGDAVDLRVIVPAVGLGSDGPGTTSTVAGFAFLVTTKSSIGGPDLVHGAIHLYELRPLAVTASMVESIG